MNLKQIDDPNKFRGVVGTKPRGNGLHELAVLTDFRHPRAPAVYHILTRKRVTFPDGQVFLVTEREAFILHRDK